MIRLHLHIGQPKTGSSSIQRVMKKNHKLLIKNGYLYDAPRVNHQNIIQKIAKSSNSAVEFKQFIDNKIKVANKLRCNHIVISSESLFFMHDKKINTMMKQFKVQVSVYAYLRRQDMYMESAWKQWHFKNLSYKNFDDYVNSFKVPNYYFHLHKWGRHVDSEDINVIAFEKRNFPEGLEKHFLQTLGIDDVEAFDFSIEDDGWGENKGLSGEGLELAFQARELAENNIHNHSIQFFINKYFSDFQKEHFTSYNLLSLQQRKEIIKRHDATNRKIANKYLNSDKPLFLDPIKSGQLKQSITPEAITKALMTIGMRQDKMIEQLHKEIREIKKTISG